MASRRKNRREEIVAATVRLVAKQGVTATPIRQIASEAGVTEGALYRHFENKDDLCQQAYQQIVADMAVEKERILKSPEVSLASRLHGWIRLSFEYFDKYPEAFTYVLLTPYDFAESDISRRQGRMLTEWLANATRAGDLPDMDPVLSMALFSGLMLNVPRLINEGILSPPVTRYVDSTAAAACAIFGLSVDLGESPS
jgi:AcrR family transcriptional regulator